MTTILHFTYSCHRVVVWWVYHDVFHYRHIRLPRKEVIQPHLPVRLPCYDFVPVATPALGRSLLTVSARTSGIDNSHDVTGGVYKPRVRIHRAMLIHGY